MNNRLLHVKSEQKADNVFIKGIEDGTIDREQLWEDSFNTGEAKQFEYDGVTFTCKALKFGTLDGNFIDYIQRHVIDNNNLPDFLVSVGGGPAII